MTEITARISTALADSYRKAVRRYGGMAVRRYGTPVGLSAVSGVDQAEGVNTAADDAKGRG